ncbi:MAG: exodeoxyribonuclease VII large subunit [Euryarchaeota archaeon]|nr:exodeoxyribonuclease VII large subunit [Euryarchaeota archaeon]MBT6640350.1 exodeoxyribonuclease VII large subunit [Euryarchaeota archaeon]MBT6845504.1 exodeoxyribonuclease VII large subunit [Euryarchaeota archaeon]MBT7063538.1 exodeoxyribonuclease VII large subunit [Euryarchaeota archaeon]MBT7637907.1 exodeoxyribonuclease VII large subunit [Euryarchaeota archaeon]
MTGTGQVTTGPLPIGQFVQLVKQTVTRDPLFKNQALKGEVTQWKQYPSGHTYFSLRDQDGQMRAVIWKGRCAIDPGIKEGSEVVILASLDLYIRRGEIQLNVERIEPVSVLGELEKTKRLLVEQLKKEGEFDRPRQAIPTIPKHIAIITGAGSAALSDMQRLIENRWPGLRRTVIGVLVQGPRATEEIVRGLAVARRLSQPSVAESRGEPPVDLVIVGRGGGSPEDLWAFNLEPVARSIIASPVPVVSAVGHESDVLVSDLVADLRASTPSDAIERVVPVLPELHYFLDECEERLAVAARRQFRDNMQHLRTLHARLRVAPMAGLNRAKSKMLTLSSRMKVSVNQSIGIQTTRLAQFEASLSAIHPQRVLERGYSMTQTTDGVVLSSVEGLKSGQEIILNFADGSADAEIKNTHSNEGEK